MRARALAAAGLIAGFLPQISKSVGNIDNQHAGLLGSAFIVGYMIGSGCCCCSENNGRRLVTAALALLTPTTDHDSFTLLPHTHALVVHVTVMHRISRPACPIFAYLAKNHQAKRLMSGGLLLWVVGAVLCGATNEYMVVLAGCVL